MIHRVSPTKHLPLESPSSCCGYSHKKELEEELSLEVKPKSAKPFSSPSTPFSRFSILEDQRFNQQSFTPKKNSILPIRLFNCKEESSTLPNSITDKSLSSPIVALGDDYASRPLQRLKNRRKSSRMSEPLSTTINTTIRFSYAPNIK